MRILLPAVLTFFLMAAVVHAAEYTAGVHYQTLSKPQPVQTGENIEVRELFWYGCPHCYRLEPYIHKWLETKPDNAEYVPMPAVLNNSWAVHGQAFYTFEILGILDQVHTQFFDAIHKDRIRFRTAKEVADWVAQFGIDGGEFMDAFDSFAVDSKMRQSQVMAERYEIDAVPTIIIDGKYRTSVTMAGSNDALMDVVNFLVDKSAQERQ